MLFSSCDMNLDSTNSFAPGYINGRWKMEFTISTASQIDSVKCNMDINGTKILVSGHSNITYSGSKGGTRFLNNIDGYVFGTYRSSSIDLTVQAYANNDTYRFVGNLDNKSSSPMSFKGNITITIGGSSIKFIDQFLVKETF
jgi:hypothetical protein